MRANGSNGRRNKGRESDANVVLLAEDYEGAAPGQAETEVQDEFIKAQERDAKPDIEFHQTDPSAPLPDNEFEMDPLTLEPRRVRRPSEPLVLDEPDAAKSDPKLAEFIRQDSRPKRTPSSDDGRPFHARENRGGVAASDKFPVAALLVIVACLAGSAYTVWWWLF